ncbi:hypothetical protein Ancab_028631 [Ancistrocladus abbreviatus]
MLMTVLFLCGFSSKGKILKLARESVHVVHGFSAAIIIKEDICDEFKFKIRNGREVFKSRLHKHHVMKVGTVICFQVKSFDEEHFTLLDLCFQHTLEAFDGWIGV